MAANPARLPLRRTLGTRQPKADENAMSRHVRQTSNSATTGPIRFTTKEGIKATTTRQALSEVTIAAVNRVKDTGTKTGTGKEKEEVGFKRGRSGSTVLAQRVPLGPGRSQVAPPIANTVTARAPSGRARLSVATGLKRPTRYFSERIKEDILIKQEEDEHVMDLETDLDDVQTYEEEIVVVKEQEEEPMLMEESEAEDQLEPSTATKPPRVWPEFATEPTNKFRDEVQAIRESFHDVIDMYDTTMVSEYAEEIFEYMGDLEEEVMPNPDYMDGQNEISWGMRQTLVDWLLQVHLRYHMLPETLWIAVNIVDRFLTKRVVSLQKLQLVGVTAMFIAAKYEEIIAPAVDEFVYMTEKGYTKEEILKGERIMLQTLDFRISHYCSPYSWMRKISRADDYDIQTRTLSKFLTEVTLLDHRFLRAKPSIIAAVGMYCARKMLGGNWNEAFVFHSSYTEEQLLPGHDLLVEKLTEDGFHKQYVCRKYANKKFLKASVFAIDWAKSQLQSRTADEPDSMSE